MVRHRVVVAGRVQGVFFRDSCQQQARALGVTGWVRNNRDGTVEAAIEGEQDAVEKMIDWMRVGPSRAVVTSVDVRAEEPEGDTKFTVRGF